MSLLSKITGSTPLSHRVFRFVWRAYFKGFAWNGREPKLVKILGWRSCRWDSAGGRETVTFEPEWMRGVPTFEWPRKSQDAPPVCETCGAFPCEPDCYEHQFRGN